MPTSTRDEGFKYHLAARIMKWRVPILILSLAATVIAVLCIPKTRLNYDLSEYLSKDTLTARSLAMMNAEFDKASQLSVMLSGEDGDKAAALVKAFSALDGVAAATHDVTRDVKTIEGREYRLITLSIVGDVDAERFMADVDNLLADCDASVEGEMQSDRMIRKSMAEEIPAVLLISVVIVLIVLFIMSHSWIEPLLFVCVLAVSILINMGTNFIFPTISYITYAVTAILQLALAMDYSIMLLTHYDRYLDSGLSEREAVTRALAASFLPVSASSLTTAAGLAALMFMSFTIGFDIGIVLTKGILLSMLTVFLLMPALILLFSKALRRTRHKAISLGGERVARLSWKCRKTLPWAFAALIVVAFVLQSGNTYLFGLQSTDKDGALTVSDVFGGGSAVALLVPRNGTPEDYDGQRALILDIERMEIDGRKLVQSVAAMPIQGDMAIKTYTADEAAGLLNIAPLFVNMFYRQNNLPERVTGAELIGMAATLLPDNAQIKEYQALLQTARNTFEGEKHARILLSLDLKSGDPKNNEAVDGIEQAVRARYGEDYGMAGGAVLARDISTAFKSDLLLVSLLTIAAIYLIIALSFKSFSIPVLLVCVIQGAIFINMAVSRLAGEGIFFMSYLICVAIQMGATIDYGILLTDNYRLMRRDHDKFGALRGALRASLPTILTSGVILISAGYAIHFTCSVFYISSIGHLLGRGAAVSVVMITVLLPELLTVFDKFVVGRGKRAGVSAGSSQM